jgi:hypothetical protein
MAGRRLEPSGRGPRSRPGCLIRGAWRDPDSNRHDFQSCCPGARVRRFAASSEPFRRSRARPDFLATCGRFSDVTADGRPRRPFRRGAQGTRYTARQRPIPVLGAVGGLHARVVQPARPGDGRQGVMSWPDGGRSNPMPPAGTKMAAARGDPVAAAGEKPIAVDARVAFWACGVVPGAGHCAGMMGVHP